MLRLEHGAEAASAQVVQVGQLLVGDRCQGAGQTSDIHTARRRGRLHGRLWSFYGNSLEISHAPGQSLKAEVPFS